MSSSPLETWSDEQLALEAQAGSSVCFETLVRRYQARLVGFAARSISRADAEDVTQDAFVQAYLNLARYNVRWRFKTWLFVIAQRLLIDRLRRTRRRRQDGRELGEADAVTESESVSRLSEREESARLWSIARETLGEEPMRAVWLHYVEQMGTRDVARVMGRSWVWVKTTLHRARRKLEPVLSEFSADRETLAETERSPKRPARIRAPMMTVNRHA